MQEHFIPLPSPEEVEEHLHYDPKTGIFIRRKSSGGQKAGSPVGFYDTDGYKRTQINGSEYRLHRLAWLLGHRQDPGEMDVDHINGVRDDNRLANLRLTKRGGNNHNRKLAKNNKSGVKGVSICPRTGLWRVQIMYQGKLHMLGVYDDLAEAAGRVALARMRLHGEFGRHK